MSKRSVYLWEILDGLKIELPPDYIPIRKAELEHAINIGIKALEDLKACQKILEKASEAHVKFEVISYSLDNSITFTLTNDAIKITIPSGIPVTREKNVLAAFNKVLSVVETRLKALNDAKKRYSKATFTPQNKYTYNAMTR